MLPHAIRHESESSPTRHDLREFAGVLTAVLIGAAAWFLIYLWSS